MVCEALPPVGLRIAPQFALQLRAGLFIAKKYR
jgi:hypothetical protein